MPKELGRFRAIPGVIRELRESALAQPITQQELANLMTATLPRPISRSMIRSIELGILTASTQQAVALSRILKKDVNEIFQSAERNHDQSTSAQ